MTWRDQPAVVIASGPSLTGYDVELVRQSGFKTIAVNTTWQKAPFCDVIYGGDLAWWKHYGAAVTIPAERWTCSKTAAQLHDGHYRERPIKPGYNSGLLAVELAVWFGASSVLMLGFDCSVKRGIHHHGRHKKTGNPTADRCTQWQKQWRELIKLCPDASIINCSRYTEIDCVPRADLEQTLCALS